MIASLMIAGLMASQALPPHVPAARRSAPGQIEKQLIAGRLAAGCIASGSSGTAPCTLGGRRQPGSYRLTGALPPAYDVKMDAYRFEDRPCDLIGRTGCPSGDARPIWRLGEPVKRTLIASFLPSL